MAVEGDSAKAYESCEGLLRMVEKKGLKRYIVIGRKTKGEILLFKASSKIQAPNCKQMRNSKFKSPDKTAKEPTTFSTCPLKIKRIISDNYQNIR